MATSQNKNISNKKAEGRPLRVWAAILFLVIVIASIFYFNRDTPLPKELKEAISDKNTDSVWTYSNADSNTIALKTPSGDQFSLTKNGETIASFTVNGKEIKLKELDKHASEIAVLLGELRNRNKQ